MSIIHNLDTHMFLKQASTDKSKIIILYHLHWTSAIKRKSFFKSSGQAKVTGELPSQNTEGFKKQNKTQKSPALVRASWVRLPKQYRAKSLKLSSKNKTKSQSHQTINLRNDLFKWDSNPLSWKGQGLGRLGHGRVGSSRELALRSWFPISRSQICFTDFQCI